MATAGLKASIAKLWRKQSASITEEDPTFRSVYLGNTVTQWAKGDGSMDKPLATLWRNYCQSLKPDIEMRVTITVAGLKATTREHGLTEYWSHRITYALAHPNYPKVFAWVYRHEGRKMKPELRCHAVLCSSQAKAQLMQRLLTERLHQALVEFRKEKQLRQNARLSVLNVLYPAAPRRKVFLTSGGVNYRPPLERSKSAPKLSCIEEDREGEERAERQERQLRLSTIAERAEPGRPRALSEPLGPPPAVSSHPAASGSDSDSQSSGSGDTLSSDDSEHSVPSDPTADTDSERRLAVYQLASGRCLGDQVRLQVCSGDQDDTASDESGYSEEREPAGPH